MVATTRIQNRYDHRLRELVHKTQDVSCALQYGVPRSTARSWLIAPSLPVATADPLHMDVIQLQQELLRLRTRIQKLIALLRVLLVVLKLSRFSLDQTRLPDGNHKRSLLRAIDRARSVLPLRSVLRVIRLSPSRSLNTLDAVSAVEKLVRFYVHEHNTGLPHSAFQGQTPDEMYFQNGDHIPQQQEAARQQARQARAEANRKRDCGACELLAASRN